MGFMYVCVYFNFSTLPTKKKTLDKHIQLPNWSLEPYLDDKVLVWAADHEHAVFGIHEEIHPAAKLVWFQFVRKWEEREDIDRRILVYERKKRNGIF